jgi:hypothetical protein
MGKPRAAFFQGRSRRTASAPDRDTGGAQVQPTGIRRQWRGMDMRASQVERRKRIGI